MSPRVLLNLALLLAGLLLVVTACGGSEPVSFSELPIYPGATEIQSGEISFADQITDLMAETSAAGNASTEVMITSLPQGTSWNQVSAFFADELRETDWQDDASLSQSSEMVSMAGWTRGSGANEQALLVGHTVDPLSGRSLAILVLISER